MAGDFFEREQDYARNSTVIRIFHDQLISHVSAQAVMRMIAEEIQTALTTDPELRILVREMVKEAISRMNVQEVVAEAVKIALKAEPPAEPTPSPRCTPSAPPRSSPPRP